MGIAEAFAAALDASDVETVRSLLAPDYQYDLRGASHTTEGVLHGPIAILESYAQHNQRARAACDRVGDSSEVEDVQGRTAVIRFADVIHKTGRQHTYHCRQRISVNELSLIAEIVQEEIPGELAAVRTFMREVGVELPDL